MNSFAIFLLTLLALGATINALDCRPLTCLVVCRNGYQVDAQGCPVCRCRLSSTGSSTFAPRTTNRLGATGTSTTPRTTPTRPRTTATTRRSSTTRRH